MTKWLVRVTSIIPLLAFMIAVGSAQVACWIFFNQPDMPEALKKYDE